LHPDNPPIISFIIPAHNEQSAIGRTLSAINDSARAVGQLYEIIVVNDASTDATAEIARQHNATVLPVNHRQIAATRNSGGRAARGERLFFVDADTTINPQAVASALRAMDKGAAGGGAPVWFDGNLPLYMRLFGFLPVIGAKIAGLTGGAFMFCTRKAFQKTGGFNERLYWAEEGAFAVAMQREGRFVVLWKPVVTSGRRFRTLSLLDIPIFLARAVFSPVKTFTRRSSVEKIWYDSNREADDKMPSTLGVKLSNGLTLLILMVLVTGPVWNFIPWSLTPRGTPLGEVRLVIGVFLCHVGLIFWPCAGLLIWSLLRHFFVRNMFRQRLWKVWIKLAVLAAVCLWQAWDCTQGVIWFWPWFCHHLAHFFYG
jgi:glycosyltransferase involved in cell wall biosynthesis